MKDKVHEWDRLETTAISLGDVNNIVKNALAKRNHKKFDVNDWYNTTYGVIVDNLQMSHNVRGDICSNKRVVSFKTNSEIPIELYANLLKKFSKSIAFSKFTSSSLEFTNGDLDSFSILYSEAHDKFAFGADFNTELDEEAYNQGRVNFIRKFYSDDSLSIVDKYPGIRRLPKQFCVAPKPSSGSNCEIKGDSIYFTDCDSINNILDGINRLGRLYGVDNFSSRMGNMGSFDVYIEDATAVMDKFNSCFSGPWKVNYGISKIDATEIHKIFEKTEFTVTELFQLKLKGVGYAKCTMIYENGQSRLQFYSFEKIQKGTKRLDLLKEYINSLAGRDICSGGRVW